MTAQEFLNLEEEFEQQRRQHKLRLVEFGKQFRLSFKDIDEIYSRRNGPILKAIRYVEPKKQAGKEEELPSKAEVNSDD